MEAVIYNRYAKALSYIKKELNVLFSERSISFSTRYLYGLRSFPYTIKVILPKKCIETYIEGKYIVLGISLSKIQVELGEYYKSTSRFDDDVIGFLNAIKDTYNLNTSDISKISRWDELYKSKLNDAYEDTLREIMTTKPRFWVDASTMKPFKNLDYFPVAWVDTSKDILVYSYSKADKISQNKSVAVNSELLDKRKIRDMFEHRGDLNMAKRLIHYSIGDKFGTSYSSYPLFGFCS